MTLSRGTDAEAAAGSVTIVGRQRERAFLRDAIAAGVERGVVVVVTGPPGVGKTCLLADAVGRLTGTGAVVRLARGLATESVLPFAAASDLLEPFLAQHLASLPPSQQEALRQAFAVSDSSTAATPYTAYVGALALVSHAAERSPVVLLIDDLQWVDDASQRLLAFVARRIESDRICILAAAREVPAPWRDIDELRYLELPGLEERACASLLHHHGEFVSNRVVSSLAKLTAGNPLVLLETARQLRPDQRAGHQPLPDQPALGARVEAAWSQRLNALPQRTQDALLLLAAHHSTFDRTVEEALCAAGLELDDLVPAVNDGLVVRRTHERDFFHPLFRTLVLCRATDTARRRAYGALADVAPVETRAWYVAASTSGRPNESVAVQLEASADGARRRHGYAAASAAMRKAADLTSEPASRCRRLVAAASDALLAGQLASVHQCCESGLAISSEPALRAALLRLEGQSLMWVGDVTRAREIMIGAAAELEQLHPGQALTLLSEATLPSVMAADIGSALAAVDRCLVDPAYARVPAEARIFLVQAMLTGGRIQQARDQLDLIHNELRSQDPILAQLALCLTGQCLTWIERFRESRGLLSHLIDTGRRAQAPSLLPYALAALSEVDRWQARWPNAYANATEALSWAVELGQQGTAGYSQACLARQDAAKGDVTLCVERSQHVLAVAETLGVGSLRTYAEAALGLAALGAGELDSAVEHLRVAHGMGDQFGLAPTIVPYVGDLIEALVHRGDAEEAMEIAEWLTRSHSATGMVWPNAVALACRGFLTMDPDEAEATLRTAGRNLEDLGVPFERARVQLWLGERLRRDRRPAAARQPLREALRCFDALGAQPWVERAGVELTAAGGRDNRPSERHGVQLLTPQELQVAQLVSNGMNNPETAAALFISRRTVEAHLTRIYRKLSIRSRTDLARVLSESQ